MTARQWQLDPLEFTVLWEQFGRDRLPYPFQYRSSEETADDYQRARSAAATRVQAQLDEELYRAAATLADTTMWIAAFGLDRMGSADERVVRAHAGIQAGLAAVAVQEPGESEDCGGAIRLTLVNARNAPTLIAAALPKAKAGSRKGFSVRNADLGRRPGASVLSDPRSSSAREQLSQFVDRPTVSAGEITVTPGVAIDTRPNPEMRGFHWVDYVNDGRYVTQRTDSISAEPASEEVVAERIRLLIASTQRRLAYDRDF